ncbi:unnamed protein product, partial [Oppiella nova]
AETTANRNLDVEEMRQQKQLLIRGSEITTLSTKWQMS